MWRQSANVRTAARASLAAFSITAVACGQGATLSPSSPGHWQGSLFPPENSANAAAHAYPHGGAVKPVPSHVRTARSPIAPAAVYAGMTAEACGQELTARQVSFEWAEDPVRGVSQPVRLSGPIHGVHVVSRAGRKSIHNITDCRLALALSDFAGVLAAHGVREIRHMSIYRPGAKIRRSGRPSQHGAGLAIDIGDIIYVNGAHVVIEDHWNGEIGAPVCSEDAPTPESDGPAAHSLRSIVCHTNARGIFNVILTPNYDRAHRDHWHLDINENAAHFTLR